MKVTYLVTVRCEASEGDVLAYPAQYTAFRKGVDAMLLTGGPTIALPKEDTTLRWLVISPKKQVALVEDE